MGEGMEVVGVLLPLFALLLAAGGVSYLGFILLQALRAKLLGRADAGDELEALLARVADLEEHVAGGAEYQSEQRLLDLEERVDFAERLLASERERAALPEPSDEVSAPSHHGKGV